MKKKKIIFYSLMFLPLIVVLIALPFLPERIPAHYDFNNQVTRWGSKYETLIFPVITVLFGYFMLGMAKFSSKQEENGSNNENVCICLLYTSKGGLIQIVYLLITHPPKVNETAQSDKPVSYTHLTL